MGRHSITLPVDVKSSNAVRGLAIASALGVLAGAGIPVAMAAPQAEGKAAPEGTANASVSLSKGAAKVAKEQEAQSVVLGGSNAEGWELQNLAVDASLDSPVVEASEAVREVAPRAGGSSTVAAASAAPAIASGDIASIARAYSGVPYVWGGSTPSGWDCSGFTSWVYAQVGISLPHSSEAQLRRGTVVSAAQAQPGDIVYWPGHVGIYTGNGMYVAAHTPAQGTSEATLYGNPTFVRISR